MHCWYIKNVFGWCRNAAYFYTCVHRYLKGVEPAQCPHLKIPMHCVLQLNPKGYGYEEWR